MKPFALKNSLEAVRETTPLVHCITNYVTVNDCANALLACGGSPIMSDEPLDVVDITTICGGLVLNIGTLNVNTIEAMKIAGQKASELNHPIILDPVGAGASALRTQTASALLDELNIGVIRGNMSEIKALAGSSHSTRGVDVNPDDVVTEENLVENAKFAQELSVKTKAIIAITGAIDIVANSSKAYAIRNGSPLMGKITGTGCMLSCVIGAYAVASGILAGQEASEGLLDAVVAAIVHEGYAGEIAAKRMSPIDGNGSFRTYLLDAICNMSGDSIEGGAKVSAIA